MLLTKAEAPQRVQVVLNKTIKPKDVTGGLMMFGEQNDYPNIIESVVNSSSTAKASHSVYSKFLIGHGFNAPINDIIVGKDARGKDIKASQLLRMVASSIAYFNGYIIHVNKTITNEVKDCRIIPFKNFRFNMPDDLGFSSKGLIYHNWNNTDNWNKKGFQLKDVKSYDFFTNDEKSFINQVKKTGTIEKYNGQLFFQFFDDLYLYPLSPFDSVYLDCDTESEISVFKNREIRNGFMATTVMRIADTGNKEDNDAIVASVTNAMGANGDRVILLTDKIDEDTKEIVKNGSFALDRIETNINDKLFENWEKSLSNNIRKAIKALPAVLIDFEQGKLSGTSGESIVQAVTFYNAMTADDRNLISESLGQLFSSFENPTLKNNTDWSIKPLNMFENAAINIQSTTGN